MKSNRSVENLLGFYTQVYQTYAGIFIFGVPVLEKKIKIPVQNDLVHMQLHSKRRQYGQYDEDTLEAGGEENHTTGKGFTEARMAQRKVSHACGVTLKSNYF